MEGVPKGRYRIQWRMRFTLSAQWNESLDFTAHVGNEVNHQTNKVFHIHHPS